jgi:uncharacterized protein (DUF697 family)
MEEFAENDSWLAERIETALRSALAQAYETVRVHPEQFLTQLRRAHGLAVAGYEEMFTLPVSDLDSIAEQTIRGSMKFAAAEGAGLGLGGLATVVPDMGILAAITLRMLQKLSLVYGFEFNTDEETAQLWIAAATASGVDLGKELLEKTVLRTFVERVAARISEKLGAELAEKAAARALPIISSVVGGVLNYYFVRAWGQRARNHFRERHLEERSRRAGRLALRGDVPAL